MSHRQKIDISKPVCTTESFPAAIHHVDDDGRIHGEIVVNGSPTSLAWNAYGEYHESHPDKDWMQRTWDIRNVPEGYAMIDITRPVETFGGHPVTDIEEFYVERKGAFLNGLIQIDPDSYITRLWTRFGRIAFLSNDDPCEYHIRNVPESLEDTEREPIDWLNDKPVRDLVAEQRQIEADEIAEFRDILKHYVEKRLGRPYDPSFHGIFAVGREVGFVQLNREGGTWEVWDLCDDFRPIDTLPEFIPADELGYFWNWLREREKTAEQAGAERGFRDGTESFQRRLQDLLGLNPNKFYRKD